MEDLLVALLQGVFAIIFEGVSIIVQLILEGLSWCCLGDLINFFGQIFAEIIGVFTDSWPGMSDNTRAGWISVPCLAAGLATGALSLFVHHDVFLRRSALRLMAFGLGPVLSGYIAWLNAKLTISFRTTVRPAYWFVWMFLFSLGVCLVRFGFCHRPIA